MNSAKNYFEIEKELELAQGPELPEKETHRVGQKVFMLQDEYRRRTGDEDFLEEEAAGAI